MKRRKMSSKNFIEHIIDEDLEKGFDKKKLKFRFPPEPNGYLHIGHVKAICLNFELGKKYNAPVNLRFDDTNPVKENKIFVDAIKDDISWLQYKWEEEKYASDYFQQLYLWALELIKKGKIKSNKHDDIDSNDKKTSIPLGKTNVKRKKNIGLNPKPAAS